MYAVIKSGGKQYKVTINDVIRVEKLEAAKGEVVVLDQVLMFIDEKGTVTLGSPLVADYKVAAEVLDQAKGEKVLIFKKRRRHNYRRKRGHRQDHTWLKITEIGRDVKVSQKKAKPAVAESAKAEKAKPEVDEAKTETSKAKSTEGKATSTKKKTSKE